MRKTYKVTKNICKSEKVKYMYIDVNKTQALYLNVVDCAALYRWTDGGFDIIIINNNKMYSCLCISTKLTNNSNYCYSTY